jgi:type I restriction enzyme S subunit
MSEQVDLTDYADSDSNSKWTEKQLGDIFNSIYSGGTPKRGVDEYYGGDIPFVKIEDLNRQQGEGVSTAEESITEYAVEDTSVRAFESGSLLLTIYGSLAETAMVNSKVATNQGILGLWDAPDDNVVFVRYAIADTQSKLASLSRQTTQANLGKGIVKKHRIPVPPLSEQRKIATVLHNVNQAIQKTETIVRHTKRLRKSLLNELLVLGYDKNRSRQEGYVGPRQIEYPHNWVSVELGDLTDKITKGKTPTSYGYEYTDSGINFVKVESISDYGSIDKSEFDFIGQDAHEHLSGSALEEGDVLFSIAGALGKVTQISEDVLPANTNQALAIIRVNDSRVIPEYIRYYLETTLVQKYIQSIATTTAQSNLNLKQVSEFKILLPDIKEQENILQVIHTIEDKLRCEYSQKEQYKRLKQGLMQDLLSGTVRTTDTNIEIPDEIVQYG